MLGEVMQITWSIDVAHADRMFKIPRYLLKSELPKFTIIQTWPSTSIPCFLWNTVTKYFKKKSMTLLFLWHDYDIGNKINLVTIIHTNSVNYHINMFLHLPTKDLCELGKYHNELNIHLCKVLNTFYQYSSLSMAIVTRYGSDCTLPPPTLVSWSWTDDFAEK